MALTLRASDRLTGFLHRLARALINRGRRVVWHTARILYHATPLPTPTKRAIARKLLPPPPEVAAPIEIDYSLAVPFGYAPAAGAPRLTVICHIFYDALAPEIRRYLRNIPFPFDLFISTDDDAKKATIEGAFADFKPGRVEVRLAPNRGRDIAPKLVSFADVYGDYDYALHLHSKASKHADVLELWRVFLFENLLGSPAIVNSVFDAFARRPDLGIVASQHFEAVRHWINWGGNFKTTTRLAERLGIPLVADKLLDFPSGSMFWARTAALKPLLDLGLRFEDFDIESGQTDRTLAHAVERLYFHVGERAGYRWLKISHPPLFAATPAIVPVNAPDDLDRFMAEHTRALLGDSLPAPRKTHLKRVLAAAGLMTSVQEHALGSAEVIDQGTRVVVGISAGANAEPTIESANAALNRAGVAAKGRVMLVPTDLAALNEAMRDAFAADADIYISAGAAGTFDAEAIGALLRMMQVHDGRALIGALLSPETQPQGYDPTTLETGWVSAACLAIPRAVFAVTDGFDTVLGDYADVDLSWRARALGFAVRVCPRAVFNVTPTPHSRAPSSALLLARKWDDAKAVRRFTRKLAASKAALATADVTPVAAAWRRIADFTHDFPGPAR